MLLADLNFLIQILELPGRPMTRGLRVAADKLVAKELESSQPPDRDLAMRVAKIAVPEGCEFLSVDAATNILASELGRTIGKKIDDRSVLNKHWQGADTAK